MFDENDQIQQFKERYCALTTELRNDLGRQVSVDYPKIQMQFQELSRSDTVPDVELSVVRRGLLNAVIASSVPVEAAAPLRLSEKQLSDIQLQLSEKRPTDVVAETGPV